VVVELEALQMKCCCLIKCGSSWQLCAGTKLLKSVGWLEKNLGVANTAGAGAVTEMEVLLHSAWFRLELCAG